MKSLKSVYWDIRNTLQASYLHATKRGTGLLSHKRDERDFVADLGFFGAKPNEEEVSIFDGKIFDQSPFNICVFASHCMGVSYQTGIRWSVRWFVICARRLKMLKGDGWSYLRAALKIAKDIGYLPYHEMPDEISGMDWNEYSTVSNAEFARLSTIAEKYKAEEYRRVNSRKAAYRALETGYALITALNWYTGNNRPQSTGYVIDSNGSKVGGHAIDVTGYTDYGELFENPQTFGKNYGKNGTVWLSRLFGRDRYEIYIIEPPKNGILVKAFLNEVEGKMVRTKGDISCYVIENGTKRHVPGDDGMKTYFELEKKVGLTYVKQSLLDLVPEGKQYKYV